MATPAFEKLSATVEEIKKNTDESRREELHTQFWIDALTAFNEDIAGTVTTVHGVTITTPKFEFEI